MLIPPGPFFSQNSSTRRRGHRLALALTLMVFAAFATQTEAARPAMILHVAPNGAGDGSTWSQAMNLSAALDMARPGDEVWVQSGVHVPVPLGGDPRCAYFPLKSGVAIYGGFTGTETDRSQRNHDPLTNSTVLSGDLDGDDVGFSNNDDNTYSVVIGSGSDATAILDGFTIRGGNNTSAGGGMYNAQGSPTLTNLIFYGNVASTGGGGLYNYQSSPALTHVVFFANRSEAHGGGLYNNIGSHPTLTNVVFGGNSAVDDGGGIHNHQSSPVLNNVVFGGNSAGGGGGGIHNDQSSPVLTNCTFSGNSASEGGAIDNKGGDQPSLRNCILWDNGGDEIHDDLSSESTVSDSIVEGGWVGGTNILDADPLFVAAMLGPAPTLTGNLRLKAGSPAIDRGNGNVSHPALSGTDLDGKPRVAGARVDLGAYEFEWENTPVSEKSARLTLSGSGRFRATKVGRGSRVQRFTVRNVGDLPVAQLTTSLTGGGRRHFSLRPILPGTLAPGKEARVRVRFQPHQAGRWHASLTVSGAGLAPVARPLFGLGKLSAPIRPPRTIDRRAAP